MDITQDQIAKLSFEGKKELLRSVYAADVHRFFRDLVKTLDEHDKTGHPIKPIPYHWRYIPELVDKFESEPWLFVLKSRQIMATWTALAYALWVVLFHSGKKVAIQSKKADDADALIQRMKIIYDNLPSWKPEVEFAYCRIKIPTINSDVFGIPQGPDQVRSYTYSLVISDEYGFQQETDKTFEAVKPIVDGGGKFFAITTPPRDKNFAYACLSNPVFYVHKIHYSSRPDRDAAWQKQARKGYPEEVWNREYELQFLQSGVRRVLADFMERRHVSPSLIYNRDVPLLRCWDFGYRRPFAAFCQIDDHDRFLILNCILGRNVLIDAFADRVIGMTNLLFPDAVVQDFCDPAGVQVNDKTELSSIQILRTKGIHPRYRKSAIEDGLNLMRRKMITDVGGKPCFQIAQNKNNQYLIDGMTFGYFYRDSGVHCGDTERNDEGQIEKEYYEHGIDGIRYILVNIYCLDGHKQDQNTKTSALVTSYPTPQTAGSGLIHGRSG